MNVIIINESQAKAWLRTRRVLSKYLPQIGSRTWSGHITSDGLQALHLKLKDASSKTTSIVCHRIVNRSRIAVEWTVGSTASFNEDSRYAFRQTALKQEKPVPVKKSGPETFAVALTRLAALFHDLGKASIAFQRKLKNGGGAEVVRHDVLSFMIVAESLWREGISEEFWLKRLVSSPADACACVSTEFLVPITSTWLARVHSRIESKKSIFISKSELSNLDGTAPGLLAVLWLVLTHHRLPTGDDIAEQLDAGRHLNIPYEGQRVQPASLADCLTPHNGAKPWQDEKWKAAVSSAAKAALAALAQMRAAGTEPTSPYFWPQITAHILRPSLILSDHIGSLQADKNEGIKKAFSSGQIFANLKGKRNAGDTLSTHLMRVSTLSRQITGTALSPARLPHTALPDNSAALSFALPAQFAWQKELGEACQEAHSFGPSFVSIIAETGAGKTIAGVRAMHFLSGGAMRFTLALGLRSLTWQSATSMLEDARIHAKDMTVAVGQPQTLGLSDSARNNQLGLEAAGSVLGSESADGVEVSAALSNTDFDALWCEGFCTKKEAQEFWGKPALSLITAPVLACTVDHLVSAASLLRGGDAKLFLRQTNSDLLLDEIDSYSATDLQTIGKLTYIAGLHGRNVVLMSATMSPAVQNGLFESWRAGVAIRAELKSIPLAYGTVYSANTRPCVVLNTPTLPEACGAWLQFVRGVAECYARSALLGGRRCMGLHTLSAKSAIGAFAEITDIAQQMHDIHHTVDPQTGRRVSVGFVRLNTAKNAWRFASYLASRPATSLGPDIRFVAYHSKFPRNYLGVLDATLGQMTARKTEHAFLETPALRHALGTAKSENLVVIVCTTTLIETGRDFDFDWAVLEPRSVRGEVQAAGRVRRHRQAPLATSSPNIILLSTPLKALEEPDRPVWGHPGVEDALPGLRVNAALPAPFKALSTLPAVQASGARAASSTVPAPRSRPGLAKPQYMALAADALPLAAWNTALDAQLCIETAPVYENNRIGYLEQAVQALNLSHPGPWSAQTGLPPSLCHYLTSFAPLNSRHAIETRFRGGMSQTAVFVPRPSCVEAYDEVTKGYVRCLAAEIATSPSKNALLPDLAQQADKLAVDDRHIIGAALRCPEGGASFKPLTWSPLLGFLE